MRARERALARYQIDKRLKNLQNMDIFARPPRGWIKAIREALGMTATQLGKRLGVSQPRVLKIEDSEVSGNVTLETLERAARALDCQLVYMLVPRQPLEEMIFKRAEQLAREQIEVTGHSMALEDQCVDAPDESLQIEALTRKLLARSPSKLWDKP